LGEDVNTEIRILEERGGEPGDSRSLRPNRVRLPRDKGGPGSPVHEIDREPRSMAPERGNSPPRFARER
jgi:hypothetical protein